MKLNYEELCWLEDNILEIPMWAAVWTFIIGMVMSVLFGNADMTMTTLKLSGGVVILGEVASLIVQAFITEKLDLMENKKH